MKSSKHDETDTMTDAEAAAYLKVDVVTVQRQLRRGRLPGRQVGRAWRLSRQALRGFLAGGDPTRAMNEAGFLFARGGPEGLHEGLSLLLRNVVADERMPPDLRRDLLRKVNILVDAEEKDSVTLARKARFTSEPQVEERRGNLIVYVNRFWNSVVEDFVSGLNERRKRSD